MRRNRRGEEISGGLHPDGTFGGRTARGETAIRNHHGGVGVAAGLAESRRRHARSDGIDRFLLEAGIQRTGGKPESLPGQSAGSEEPQGPQNRRQGWLVAGTSAAARHDLSQFHSPAGDSRTARSDEKAQAAAGRGRRAEEQAREG